MSKLLVVDDDAHIRELIRVFLRNEGIEALSKLDSVKVDLAVIDIMMPKMDGWKLCAELKATFDIPVLMLTVKGETSQKLKGFQLGTDDYLVKPFEPLELVARVKALLRRYRIEASQTIQIGKLVMDRKTYQIRVEAAGKAPPTDDKLAADIAWVNWEAKRPSQKEEVLPVEISASPEALAIGVLCVRYLAQLPRENLDLVFQVFRSLPFARRTDLPRWANELINFSTTDPQLKQMLWRCKIIYVGSPLYTAFGE